MLRAFGAETRWSSVEAREWGTRLAAAAALGATAALLARVQPVAGLAPFAMAFLAAGLAAGLFPAALLVGSLTGSVSAAGFRPEIAAGAATVCLTLAAARFAGNRLPRRGRDRPAEAVRPGAAAASLAAGLAVLLPSVPVAAGGPWESLRALTAAGAAAAAAPFFRALAEVRPSRRYLMPGERVGWLALLWAVTAGAAAIGLPLAQTLAAAGILLLSPLGAGAAACAGLAAGSAMAVSGAELSQAALLGGCGLLSGLAAGRRKWCAPAALALAASAMHAGFGGTAAGWAGMLSAAAAVPWLPEPVGERFRSLTAGETRGACDPDRLAARLRAESERRLRALSEAFGELAESYRVTTDVPDEQGLICEMRSRLCENCSGYADCWTGNDNGAVRFLCQLISGAIEWGNGDQAAPMFDGETPADVLRVCRRGRSVPVLLGGVLEEFARKRRSELKRSAANQLISAQFLQAQLLLQGMAEVQARPVRVRGRQAARARAALDRAGIPAAEVLALRGGRQTEIVVTLNRGLWSDALTERAAGQLCRAFGRHYAAAGSLGGDGMRFVRLPALKVTASACCHSRQAGVPSGDSHMIRTLEGDRLLLMLSDGMGSGEAAARESAQTLRLLGGFLAAEAPRALALETVNELMLARTDADMFATVDLCVVDLTTGVAEFSKLAACRSLILRGEEVLTVQGGRLPLGILERVQPSVERVRLEPGDVILMATDGVMDAVDPAELSECLAAHGRQPPEILAERILEAAERRGNPRYRDDMTALCARISLRREKCA